MVYYAGATVLHELTHWADAQDGVNSAGADGNPVEDGNAFERGVYGKVM